MQSSFPSDEHNKDKVDSANDDDSSSSSSEQCALDTAKYGIGEHDITKRAMDYADAPKYAAENCGATKYATGDSDTTHYAIVGHDTNSSTDTASNRVATLVGNVANLNVGSERNLKTEAKSSNASSMVTQGRIHSLRKAKEDNINQYHVPEFNNDKSKEVDFEDKGKKNHTDKGDIDVSIKHSSKEHVNFFDAAIVYDKKDYEGALDLKNELMFIVRSRIYDDPRIELFDSKELAQSNIMIVEDVINRCSVILVYLTCNSTSPELHLFIEEAICISRFGYNNTGIQSGRVSNQWVLKPVHTKSRKYRDYKTPVSLLTVNGIDWFDRSSGHTTSNIVALMQTAITQRKQRDMEVNTSNMYIQVFGSLPEVPSLEPPFTNRRSRLSAKFPDAPTHWRPVRQLISHPSEDAMSMFPVMAVNQRMAPEDRPIWNEYSDANVGVYTIDHQHMPPSTSFDSCSSYGTSRDFTANPKFVSQTASVAFPGSPTMSPYAVHQQRHHRHSIQQVRSRPADGQQLAQFPVQHIQPQHLAATRPGIVYQSAGLQTHSARVGQQLRGYMNQQPPVMPTTQVGDAPIHTDFRNPQIPIYRPTRNDQHTRPSDALRNEYLSRDALPSATSSYARGVRLDTTSSSRLSVVSKVSGKLIVNPNLSTDDVEVDIVSEPIPTSNKITKKHMTEYWKQMPNGKLRLLQCTCILVAFQLVQNIY